MPWIKLDDSFYDHPKFAQVSVPATWLYFRCLGYAARHLTDGFVSLAVAVQLTVRPANTKKLATELVTARLWEVTDDGYKIHDYAVYNPSAEETRAKRAAESETKRRAGRIGAAKRWGSGLTGGSRDGTANGTADSSGEAGYHRPAIPSANAAATSGGWQSDGPVPVPVPVPSRAEEGAATPPAALRSERPEEKRERRPTASAASPSPSPSQASLPEAKSIATEIAKHRVFESLDAREIGEAHAGFMMTAPQKLAWVLAAVSDCAAKTAGLGLSPSALQSKLVGFMRHARAPRQSEDGPVRPPKPIDFSQYENLQPGRKESPPRA
ncbi:MAG TPA: hypothetical protein VK550_30890 [Polyangiaceae bacterium]|nr:hypothetical protein [Polyangiaceae bacterium]